MNDWQHAYEKLLKNAKDAFDALTPEQQAAHRREQAISWIYGEACIGLNDTWPEKHLSREECAAIYDISRSLRLGLAESSSGT